MVAGLDAFEQEHFTTVTKDEVDGGNELKTVGDTFHAASPGKGKALAKSRMVLRRAASFLSSRRPVMASSIHSAICSISPSFMPRVVSAGVPSLRPLGSKAERGSCGMVF